jgi:hypothetical protein
MTSPLPGTWELQVHKLNGAARQFWTSCLEDRAPDKLEIREIEAGDGNRLQFTFRTR